MLVDEDKVEGRNTVDIIFVFRKIQGEVLAKGQFVDGVSFVVSIQVEFDFVYGNGGVSSIIKGSLYSV